MSAATEAQIAAAPERYRLVLSGPDGVYWARRLGLRPGVDHGPILESDLYLTTQRLASDSLTLASRAPADLDLVVGVPRSGLLPATVVATHRHLPLATVRDGRVENVGSGARLTREPTTPDHILIVDDTAVQGRAMTSAAELVAGVFPSAKVTRAVVYCHPDARHAIDLATHTLPGPHFLEWNLANSIHAESIGCDFDGILCEECHVEDNDDGLRYARFLKEAKPLYLPRRSQVPLIVTARHERYRDETVAWLDRYGVSAANIIMRDWDCPDEEWIGRVAAWKGEHYIRSNLHLFVESEPAQAELIARTAGKPVLCPAAGRVFRPAVQPPQPSARGPGAVLHGWLGHFPWLASEGCGCQSDAAEMDRAGPEGVLANLDMWADRLKAKPQAGLVPKILIKAVIKRACEAAKIGPVGDHVNMSVR